MRGPTRNHRLREGSKTSQDSCLFPGSSVLAKYWHRKIATSKTMIIGIPYWLAGGWPRRGTHGTNHMVIKECGTLTCQHSNVQILWMAVSVVFCRRRRRSHSPVTFFLRKLTKQQHSTENDMRIAVTLKIHSRIVNDNHLNRSTILCHQEILRLLSTTVMALRNSAL